jgi:hypothetical protein
MQGRCQGVLGVLGTNSESRLRIIYLEFLQSIRAVLPRAADDYRWPGLPNFLAIFGGCREKVLRVPVDQ